MKSNLRARIIELFKLYQGSHIPQSYIHRALGVSKSRVSEILRDLEREGLISRFTVGKTKIVYIYPQFAELETGSYSRRVSLGIVYSSEYLFLGNFVKKLKSKGIKVDVIVYRDGLEATTALARGIISFALSPLVGQLYVYPTYRTYKVILAGLNGGFSILGSEPLQKIYSSIISTMDYIRHYVITSKLVDVSKTVYYRDPDQLLSASRHGGYFITWHPIHLDLKRRGLKTIYTWRDIDLGFCCTLGISTTVDRKTRMIAKRAYIDSIEEYKKNPERGIEYYASVTGINSSILKLALNEYQVPEDINLNAVNRIVSTFSLNVPSVDIYYEACEIW